MGVSPITELKYLMTNINHGSRKAMAEAVEKLGYRTLIVTDLLTGEVDERAGSDPIAWGSIKAAAGANRMPLVDAITRLLEGGTLQTKAYSWRLA